ncbi:MAG: RNA polymerase sigma factor [Candidatus Dormibacteria bacterium]
MLAMTLLSKTQQREKNLAFTELVDRDAQRLFRLACMILRDPSLAEDAVQESFLRAWKAWGTLQDPGRASSWLTRICVNHCFRVRQRAKRFAIWPIDTVSDQLAVPMQDTEDPDLDRAFLHLSLQQRTVVVLHYHYGYTLDECAVLMGCATGTARSHLARALTIFRNEVRHDAENTAS